MVGVTKIVSSYFPPGGIADRMIYFNGFPFLDTKEEHAFHVSVSETMTPAANLTLLPAHGISLSALTKLLDGSHYSGFPVVSDPISRTLLGFIGRTELTYAIDKAKNEQRAAKNAKCIFTSDSNAPLPLQTPSALVPPVTFDDIESENGQQTVDFSRFVDPTPLAVHPRQPLETVMELFKKMGPRVVLVEHKGRLVGLVTVKDCLKYQFQAEAQEREEEGERRNARFEKKLWGWFQVGGAYVVECMGKLSKGRIRLGNCEDREGLIAGASADPRDEREGIQSRILDGTEDDGDGVEMDDR